MEKVSGHTRLYRRGGTYYHRAKVPKDIVETYGRHEETFSLKTKDYREACRLVREKGAEVDRKFKHHRDALELHSLQEQREVSELSDNEIKIIANIYYSYILEGDDETRLAGFHEGSPLAYPTPSFEEYVETSDAIDDENREFNARGKVTAFFHGEAEEVLSWDGVDIKLSASSPSWEKLGRVIN